jgi:hypothetical protein
MANSVDAWMQPVQPTGGHTTPDRIPSQPHPKQLSPRNHPMLSLRQIRDLPIGHGANLRLGAPKTPKCRLGRHAATVTPPASRVVRGV